MLLHCRRDAVRPRQPDVRPLLIEERHRVGARQLRLRPRQMLRRRPPADQRRRAAGLRFEDRYAEPLADTHRQQQISGLVHCCQILLVESAVSIDRLIREEYAAGEPVLLRQHLEIHSAFVAVLTDVGVAVPERRVFSHRPAYLAHRVHELRPCLATGQTSAVDGHRRHDLLVGRPAEKPARFLLIARLEHGRIVGVRRIQRMQAGGIHRERAVRRIGNRPPRVTDGVHHRRRDRLMIDRRQRRPPQLLHHLDVVDRRVFQRDDDVGPPVLRCQWDYVVAEAVGAG